ncbi:LysE family translocator [Comamonas testosteroni]|uniref:LysE family translocator n=1 Tax=Comamonas testosteroni TaxID=285 RepID=UPI00391A8C0F
MVDVPLLLAFVLAASILTLTPGVDTAMVLRATTMDGRRPAVMAALGIALGCLAWGAAAAFGLGALLHASETAYTVVKWLGAAYLVWGGVKLLAAPRVALDSDASDSASHRGATAFWRGLLTNLLNPKVGIFYVTFLPQFIPSNANVAVYSFFLACCHVALTLLRFAALIAVTAPLRCSVPQ